METKGICLLVVNDDLTCRKIVAEMLKTCTYEVLYVGRALEALRVICDRKDAITLVLTNLHRIQAQGTTDILHHIQKILNLPTFLMSPDDDEKIELQDHQNGFVVYVINSSSIDDIHNLWEIASVTAMEDAEKVETRQEGSAQMASTAAQNINEAANRENAPSHGDQPRPKTRKKRNRKEKKEKSEQSEASGDDQQIEKRTRMIWNEELHKQFLEAMEKILPEKPVPKKIVEVMGMPWLRREHVASHLQKFRISLKKAEDVSSSSNASMNQRNHAIEPYTSAFDFKSLQGSSHITNPPYGNRMAPFQKGPFDILSMAATSNQPLFINTRLSSSMSNFRASNLLAGNNQGRRQQLFNPNLSSSSRALILQNNNLSAFANSQGNDWKGLLQSGFRVYGDQTKNMHFSNQGSSSTSDVTLKGKFDKNFMGFKLTSDGKCLEFGQTSLSGNKEIRTETFSTVGTSGIGNLSLHDFVHPSTSTNNIQVTQPTSQKQITSYQNEGSGDNYPSLPIDCISQLVSSLQETGIHSPSLPVGPRTSQEHHPLSQDLFTTPVNEEALYCPSAPADNIVPLQQQTFVPHYETPAYWDSSLQSALLLAFNHQQTSQPPSFAPGNDYSLQYPTALLNSILDDQPQISVPPSGVEINAHSSSLSTPQQETNVPPVIRSANESSLHEPLTSNQKMPEQESAIPSVLDELNSTWPDRNFSDLMNEPGSSSPELFWDGDCDDTLFDQLD